MKSTSALVAAGLAVTSLAIVAASQSRPVGSKYFDSTASVVKTIASSAITKQDPNDATVPPDGGDEGPGLSNLVYEGSGELDSDASYLRLTVSGCNDIRSSKCKSLTDNAALQKEYLDNLDPERRKVEEKEGIDIGNVGDDVVARVVGGLGIAADFCVRDAVTMKVRTPEALKQKRSELSKKAKNGGIAVESVNGVECVFGGDPKVITLADLPADSLDSLLDKESENDQKFDEEIKRLEKEQKKFSDDFPVAAKLDLLKDRYANLRAITMAPKLLAPYAVLNEGVYHRQDDDSKLDAQEKPINRIVTDSGALMTQQFQVHGGSLTPLGGYSPSNIIASAKVDVILREKSDNQWDVVNTLVQKQSLNGAVVIPPNNPFRFTLAMKKKRTQQGLYEDLNIQDKTETEEAIASIKGAIGIAFSGGMNHGVAKVVSLDFCPQKGLEQPVPTLPGLPQEKQADLRASCRLNMLQTITGSGTTIIDPKNNDEGELASSRFPTTINKEFGSKQEIYAGYGAADSAGRLGWRSMPAAGQEKKWQWDHDKGTGTALSKYTGDVTETKSFFPIANNNKPLPAAFKDAREWTVTSLQKVWQLKPNALAAPQGETSPDLAGGANGAAPQQTQCAAIGGQVVVKEQCQVAGAATVTTAVVKEGQGIADIAGAVARAYNSVRAYSYQYSMANRADPKYPYVANGQSNGGAAPIPGVLDPLADVDPRYICASTNTQIDEDTRKPPTIKCSDEFYFLNGDAGSRGAIGELPNPFASAAQRTRTIKTDDSGVTQFGLSGTPIHPHRVVIIANKGEIAKLPVKTQQELEELIGREGIMAERGIQVSRMDVSSPQTFLSALAALPPTKADEKREGNVVRPWVLYIGPHTNDGIVFGDKLVPWSVMVVKGELYRKQIILQPFWLIREHGLESLIEVNPTFESELLPLLERSRWDREGAPFGIAMTTFYETLQGISDQPLKAIQLRRDEKGNLIKADSGPAPDQP